MIQIESKYYSHTPTSYKFFESVIVFVTIVVGGYSIAFFGPMYMSSKPRESSKNTAVYLFELMLDNQLSVIVFLIIVGFIAGLTTILTKKRKHIVKLSAHETKLIIHTRKYFKSNIDRHEIPLKQLKVKKNTIKTRLFFGREHSLEVYDEEIKVGDFLFNHFFWSDQKLKVLSARRFLNPYTVGGKFIKKKEVEFFK